MLVRARPELCPDTGQSLITADPGQPPRYGTCSPVGGVNRLRALAAQGRRLRRSRCRPAPRYARWPRRRSCSAAVTLAATWPADRPRSSRHDGGRRVVPRKRPCSRARRDHTYDEVLGELAARLAALADPVPWARLRCHHLKPPHRLRHAPGLMPQAAGNWFLADVRGAAAADPPARPGVRGSSRGAKVSEQAGRPRKPRRRGDRLLIAGGMPTRSWRPVGHQMRGLDRQARKQIGPGTTVLRDAPMPASNWCCPWTTWWRTGSPRTQPEVVYGSRTVPAARWARHRPGHQ